MKSPKIQRAFYTNCTSQFECCFHQKYLYLDFLKFMVEKKIGSQIQIVPSIFKSFQNEIKYWVLNVNLNYLKLSEI